LTDNINLLTQLIRNFVAILVCAGLLYLVLRYYRKIGSGRGRELEILDYLRIDSKNTLCLIRVKQDILLIAVSPAGIKQIALRNINCPDKLERVQGEG